ncbi:disease resistance RPP13-like protein 4 [Neltuma alba]|uniref:disease resistance RPP13-like protein 4 n=1 Tax=Neltuma alba TaxID=207710 RepID=UPI0010A4DAC1|nr:disease resistance RPP13-like protein 4 [Prosopis alba]
MSSASKTDPTTDLPRLLSKLKKTFDETSEDISLAKDVKKTIDQYFKNQFQPDAKSEQELRPEFSKLYHHLSKTTEPSHFRSIREELVHVNKILGQHAGEANQHDFQALSETELDIIDNSEEDQLVKRLRASYEFFFGQDELKRHPRICLFLAIFPGNAVLRKRFLIYWWIGEGLVPHEEDGERVFEELLDLELLIPHGKRPRVSKCQISPWFCCMLITLAKKERLLDIKEKIPHFDLAQSRRACLIAGHSDLGIERESTPPETLRTIFNVNERDLDFPDQWLAKLKRLVVLQLGRCLRGVSRITSLPESIRELVSLEILDLKACHNLENLTDAVASLKKLTHLDISECYLMESLPMGLHSLTSLQVLKGFIIGNSQKTLIRLEHLPNLRTLKRLRIHRGSEATIKKVDFDNLKDLPKVKCIPDKKMPGWLTPSKLMNLETLYIKGGKLSDLSYNKGEKWDNVKYLVLKYTNMSTISNEETRKAMFPSLQYVKKVNWVTKRGEQEKVEFEWP